MHGDSPWRRLRDQPHVTVVWSDDLPDDVMGLAEFATYTITLATGMTQAERRSVCAHEQLHLARGPVMPHLVAREERAVDDQVARDLIPFAALVDAMIWSQDDYEIAEELTVDVTLVRARLEGLSSPESAALERALLAAEIFIP